MYTLTHGAGMKGEKKSSVPTAYALRGCEAVTKMFSEATSSTEYALLPIK